jgi:hypothetical protein
MSIGLKSINHKAILRLWLSVAELALDRTAEGGPSHGQELVRFQVKLLQWNHSTLHALQFDL